MLSSNWGEAQIISVFLLLINFLIRLMNYIDLVLGILLLVAAVRGFMKGFIVEIASLAALILAVWGAIHLSYFTGDFLRDTFDFKSEHLGVIAFIITFILIIIGVHLVGRVVTRLVEAMALGFLNKLAGILFGVLKAAVVLSIFLVFFDRVDANSNIIPRETKEKSQVYEPLKNLVPTLLPFLNFWDDDAIRNLKHGKENKVV